MHVLITGGSSGLGKALAKQYALNGHDITIVGRKEVSLKHVIGKLGKGNYIVADLTTKNGLNQVMDFIKHQRIDCLINNAGVGIYGEFNQYPLSLDQELIHLNMITPTYLMKTFMQVNQTGTIINISSIASCQEDPLMAIYGASKSYISMLSKSIQTEVYYSKQYYSIILCLPGMFPSNFNKQAKLPPLLKGTSANKIAEEIYYGMIKQKKIIIPGKMNKCAYYLSKMIPNCLMRKIEYYIQKSKR